VFDCIKRGLEAGATSNAVVTLTVIHPHSAFPFERSNDGARSHAGSRSKRPHHRGGSGLGLSSSAVNASPERTDSAAVAIGDIELDQDLSKAASSISKGPSPFLPVSSTDFLAPTKIFQPDTAHCNESKTCHNRRVPSHNRWHQPAPLSAADPTDCRLIPRWSPRPLPPVVGNQSSALDGADSPVHFEALFSFPQAVICFSLGCVVYALRALPSHFNAGIMCAWSNGRRRFGSKPSGFKRPLTGRISAFALVAWYIATAPCSVRSQVSNCETCQYVGQLI
jgi:hypothetical protein